MIAALIAGFALGLLGSLHCVGMCGPIALSLPVHRHAGLAKFVLILSYNGGRILTYSVFGFVAGIAGEALLMASSGRFLSVVAGILVILSVIVIFPGATRLPALPMFTKVRTGLASILSGRKKQGLFFLGILNGLLPCGLVYMALTASLAQGSTGNGTLLMTAFGAATLPAMIALPYAGSFISLRFRNAARKTVPYFVAFTGLLLVLRGLGLGIPYISPAFDTPAVSCHQTSNIEPQTSNIELQTTNLKPQTSYIECTGHASRHNK